MESINVDDLKKYILTDFRDEKHKYASLMDIFRNDYPYFKELKKSHKICPDVLQLFSKCKGQLNAAESIRVDAFRNLRYEQIKDYVEDLSQEKQPAIKKVERNPEGKKEPEKTSSAQNISKGKTNADIKMFPSVVCPYDLEILRCTDVKVVYRHNLNYDSKFKMPIYRCTVCGKWYTSLSKYQNKQPLTLSGVQYLNLRKESKENTEKRQADFSHLSVRSKKNCIVFETNMPVNCVVDGCHHRLMEIDIVLPSKKNERAMTPGRWCPMCGMLYVPLSVYEQHQSFIKCNNIDEIPLLFGERAKKEEEKKQQREEEKARRREAQKQQAEGEKWLAKEKKRLEEEKKRQEKEKKRQQELQKMLEPLRIKQKREEAQRKAKQEAARRKILTEQHMAEKERKAQLEQQLSDKTYAHDNTIRAKDFVVRRSVFKCMHNDHKIQNIDAVISIINKDGDVKETTVSAGYCPNCNTFFLMESTYAQLKSRGTPICRVSDEKTYLKGNNYVNGMKLAQESTLMQYGYSVSQEEDLTEARRHRILAVMIDNKILTKTAIISYLDFFISQRQFQPKFEAAISKWENDREFVSDYHKGSYTKYGVKRIYR